MIRVAYSQQMWQVLSVPKETILLESDEATLIQRAKALDSEAWTVIYERHYRQIHAYLYHRVGNPDTAEDMASSVFLQAVERIGSFDYRGIPLVAWLYRIAHNIVVDHLRRNSRVKWEPLDDPIVDKGTDPQKAAELSLSIQELQETMKELTEDQRQVVTLKFFVGLSNEEIAQIMNKPEGSVKALQHRALASLKRLVSKDE